MCFIHHSSHKSGHTVKDRFAIRVTHEYRIHSDFIIITTTASTKYKNIESKRLCENEGNREKRKNISNI